MTTTAAAAAEEDVAGDATLALPSSEQESATAPAIESGDSMETPAAAEASGGEEEQRQLRSRLVRGERLTVRETYLALGMQSASASSLLERESLSPAAALES